MEPNVLSCEWLRVNDETESELKHMKTTETSMHMCGPLEFSQTQN